MARNWGGTLVLEKRDLRSTKGGGGGGKGIYAIYESSVRQIRKREAQYGSQIRSETAETDVADGRTNQGSGSQATSNRMDMSGQG